MRLYFKPGACSLASHIVLREVGETFDTVQVDTAAGSTADGRDFRRINPKGYVPVLELDDGQVLTEGSAILQFIADRNPEARLAPPAGTLERARVQEHLNYVASEVHKAYSVFFSGKALDETARAEAEDRVLARLRPLEAVLSDGRSYLLGDTFTVADAYIFVVASWSPHIGLSLAGLPYLMAFLGRVRGRSATQAALRAEGLAA